MSKVSDEQKREERYLKITTGRIYPLLVKMAIPSMVGMIVATVYNMTDTFWVGKLNDATLTASVGVVFTFVSIIQAIGFWFGYGSGNYVSRMLGKKELEKAEEMASTGVLLGILVGIVMAVAGVFLLRPMAVLMGAGSSEELVDATIRYLRITVCSVPFMLTSNVIYNELRLAGAGGSSMIGLLVGMAANMILDPVLILTAGLGIEGAAWASFCGQILGVAVLYAGTKRGGNVRITLGKAKLNLQHLREILAGGAPNFCRQGISSISSVLLNHVAGVFGVTAIAAVTIATRVLNIAYALVIGFGQGFQPICAMNYGAGKLSRIKKAFGMTLLTVTCFLTVSAIALLYFREGLVSAFTTKEEVARLAVSMLEIWCLILPFMGYYILIGMLLQNIGRFGLATSVTTLENGFCFIPSLLICCHFWGVDGLTWCKPVASLASLLISLCIGTYAWRKYLNASERKEKDEVRIAV